MESRQRTEKLKVLYLVFTSEYDSPNTRNFPLPFSSLHPDINSAIDTAYNNVQINLVRF